MKITADTNLLVRIITVDNLRQAEMAAQILRTADSIAITLPTLCEVCWVLQSKYGFSSAEVAQAIQVIATMRSVELNRSAVEAGLQVLESGGDFADGAIAYEGMYLGGEIFVSFDRKAVNLLKRHGYETKLLHAAKG